MLLRKNRFRPRLEALEDRWTPAVNLVFDGSNLAISGDPTALTITQNAADVSVTGTDASGMFDFGPYAVTGNITATLSNLAVARTITVDLGGNTTAGSVSIFSGNNSVGTTFSVTAGTISGDLNLTDGNGTSTTTTGVINVQGSVLVNGNGGVDAVALDFGAAPDGVGGNVTVLNVNNLILTGNVGGSVTVNNAGDPGLASTISIGAGTTIGGNVTIVGGNVTDVVALAGVISGSVVASLGNAGGGANVFTSSATILGNLNYLGRSGNDVINLAPGGVGGLIAGNVAISVGNGGSVTTLGGTVLGRSISVRAGNGADVVNFAVGFSAVGARMSVLLGNGVDTFSAANLTANALARLYVEFGNGADIFIPSTVALNFPVTIRNK